MTVAGGEHDGTVRLRPRRSLLRSGIIVFIVAPIPIVALPLALGNPTGSWGVSALAEAVAVVLFIIALYLFQTTDVLISPTHVIEHGFFSRKVSTPLSEVSSIVIARTYSASSNETLPQLIVRSDRGERLLRMRGIFWTEETMREAAAALGAPLEEPTETLTPRQFFEQYRGSAYWFEGRRGLAIAVVVAVGVSCVGVVIGLMTLLGLPIRG